MRKFLSGIIFLYTLLISAYVSAASQGVLNFYLQQVGEPSTDTPPVLNLVSFYEETVGWITPLPLSVQTQASAQMTYTGHSQVFAFNAIYKVVDNAEIGDFTIYMNNDTCSVAASPLNSSLWKYTVTATPSNNGTVVTCNLVVQYETTGGANPPIPPSCGEPGQEPCPCGEPDQPACPTQPITEAIVTIKNQIPASK